ncbi:MAG: hypothetical protein Q4P15_13915, partial [Propionibacteriaceae bacterium]|nr:hypothetical protein [Propionibacteriaceae bacterium]
MRAEWQLARNLALSSSRRQRWRQVSLLLGTFLAVLVTLSGMSWLGVSQRADSIVHTRAPQWPQPGEEATAMVFGSGIILDGLSQIPLIYIEPLPGGGREALPPGLDRWPEPGEAVISPGVRRQGLTAESFGFLSSDAGSGAGGDIGDEALVSRSEGFLYVRSTEPLPVDDPEAAAFPVAGFGGDNPAFIETEPDVPALRAALGYSIWMVLVPSLFLTASSARAVSHLVDDRATSMWRLGI